MRKPPTPEMRKVYKKMAKDNPTKPTPAMRKWCRQLAKGPERVTWYRRAGSLYTTVRGSDRGITSHPTYDMVWRMEQVGLIKWEPSDIAEFDFRVALTDAGREAAK